MMQECCDRFAQLMWVCFEIGYMGACDRFIHVTQMMEDERCRRGDLSSAEYFSQQCMLE